MNLKEFIKLVEDMRKAQELYKKTYQSTAKKQARQHELQVDAMIANYKKKQLAEMNPKLF